MSMMEILTQEYDKQLGLNKYKTLIINKYDKGKLSIDKAVRLEAKVNQWVKVQRSKGRA